MRISVNLATRPFVELRPLLARLKLAMIALALLATGLILGLRILKDKADRATAQMDDLKRQTATFQNLTLASEARMRQPQNRAVLERAQFLNELFAKKSFSWTAVMMDLETVLPAGVQVTSIDPAITKEGDVNIRLRVSGERERAVQLVRNLEKSKRFVSPRLSNESLQTSQATTGPFGQKIPEQAAGVQFDILSGYNPLSVAETKEMEANPKAHAAEDDDRTGAGNAPKTAPTKARAPSPRGPKGGAR
jgi:type IV pilus assembly protein PilN